MSESFVSETSVEMSRMKDVQWSRICVSLQTEDKSRRKKALEELRRCVMDDEWSEDEFVEIWKIVNKPLARSLTDDAEFCRNLSIELWTKFLTVLPVEDKNIIHLMTILSRRLASQELLEPSEEVRLNCVKLLRLVVERYKKHLAVYYDDFVAILARTVVDSYPEVKRESCQSIEDLARAMPEQFYSRSGELVKPTLANFTHQHWKVRVASVRAIGQILLHGNSKSMEQVATPMAERLFDQSPAVRLAVVEVAGCWFLELRDRYSWWHKLLPLLLTGLHDEISDIRNRAGVLWRQAGELYMKENENDPKFKNQMDFLIEHPKHYPPKVERPNLGCRVIVRQNLCKLIPGITRELCDWLEDIKVRSAQLLCVLILNAEENITQEIDKMLPAMYRACNDDDFRVVENIELAAEYVGYFVPPKVYCPLILSTLEETISPGHLRVLAAVLRGSESQALNEKLPKLSKFLAQSHVCRSKKSRYQEQLARCCESLIRVCQKACAEAAQELFTVLFTLISTSQEEKTVKLVEDLFEELARMEELSSVEELFESHLRSIMLDLQDSCEAWTIYSAELQIFCTCLARSANAASQNSEIVLTILKSTMSDNSDPGLRLKLFIQLANYFQRKDEKMRHMKDKRTFIDSILEDVIFPGLVWSAGRAAEAIRTAALSCLCALFDDYSLTSDRGENTRKKGTIVETIKLQKSEESNPDDEKTAEIEDNVKSEETTVGDDRTELFDDPENFSNLFGKLIPVLVSLVEDNAKKTRLYALRAICLIVGVASKLFLVTDDRVNEIYPLVIRRLDDGCDDVRIAAVRALVIVWMARSNNYDVFFSRSHVDYLYTTAIVHFDDPDENFRSLMFDALLRLAEIHPEMLAEKIQNCKANFRNQTGLDKLLQHCHELLQNK